MTPLKAFLTRIDTSQAKFAERLGVSRSFMSELVNGTRRPGLSLAVQIERATEGAVPVTCWESSDTPAGEAAA